MTRQEQFKRTFKAYLTKNGYTQIKLAEKLGYDRSTINKWVTCTNQVSIEDLHRLCTIFNLDKREEIEFFKLAGYATYIELLQSNTSSFLSSDVEPFTNNQNEPNKLLAFQELLKLQDEEREPEQAVAKRLVWQAAPEKGFSGNIYNYVREYVEGLSPEHQEKLNDARRRMTHFWYRASQLVDMDILDPNQIFDSVGPPDVLTILEPLEAIQAERIDSDWQPRLWPPMKLYIVWCNQQGHIKEANQLRSEVPSRPELYLASKADILPRNITD